MAVEGEVVVSLPPTERERERERKFDVLLDVFFVFSRRNRLMLHPPNAPHDT